MINRRRLHIVGGIIVGSTFVPAEGPGAEPSDCLKATRYIDADHQTILDIAARLTDGLSGDVAKAIALFKFVRDAIAFGFARGFWDMPASEVLRVGRGYCNTKSTLFVALLRAAGIPARQVFVDIDAHVLSGLINPGTTYVDHSYVDVFLDGAWRSTDAYIVDRPLFQAAQARIVASGDLLGFGVHATGTDTWNGFAPSYSQFNILDPRPISSRRWGVYADVGDFYARAYRPWNRLNPLLRAAFGLMAQNANRRADALRSTAGGA